MQLQADASDSVKKGTPLISQQAKSTKHKNSAESISILAAPEDFFMQAGPHICTSAVNPLGDVQIASWWDYGYQTTAMANRTVIVDNNTWNNTHIATVGRAMASPEHQAWQIYRDLDVEYVLVVFGGFVG